MELERYVIPRALESVGENRSVVAGPLRPVFRDESELVPGENLPARIEQALAASESLIVICSPSSAASGWVSREISAFRRLRPNSPIVAVVIAGEPNAALRGLDPVLEALPSPLRSTSAALAGETPGMFDEVLWVDRRTAQRADISLLRIVAAMLELASLDDLIARQRASQRKRALSLIGATASLWMLVLGLAFGVHLYLDAQFDKRLLEAVDDVMTSAEQDVSGGWSIGSRMAPTYLRPLSGSYAQLERISAGGHQWEIIARSPSLFGEGLPTLPPDRSRQRLSGSYEGDTGPAGEPLRTRYSYVTLPGDPEMVRVVTAMDVSPLRSARAISWGIAGAACLLLLGLAGVALWRSPKA